MRIWDDEHEWEFKEIYKYVASLGSKHGQCTELSKLLREFDVRHNNVDARRSIDLLQTAIVEYEQTLEMINDGTHIDEIKRYLFLTEQAIDLAHEFIKTILEQRGRL